jgi:hypothetical protein
MKYRTSEITKMLLPLIDVGKHHIITGEKSNFADIKNKRLEEALYQVRDVIGGAMRASFHINRIYEDAIVCHKMVQSYPWKRNRITKSEHLHFIWSQFTNLCYLFEERYKLLVNMQHRMQRVFRKQKSISVKEGIKQIRKTLGDHIRQRGQNTHEWSTSNPHAEHFATIELINSHEPQEGHLGNVKNQYRLTRMLMRWEVETSIRFMERFLLELFAKQIPDVVECTSLFNKIVEQARAGSVSIEGSQINVTIQR